MKIGWQKHLKLNTDFIIEEPSVVILFKGGKSIICRGGISRPSERLLALFESVIGLLMFDADLDFRVVYISGRIGTYFAISQSFLG